MCVSLCQASKAAKKGAVECFLDGHAMSTTLASKIRVYYEYTMEKTVDERDRDIINGELALHGYRICWWVAVCVCVVSAFMPKHALNLSLSSYHVSSTSTAICKLFR